MRREIQIVLLVLCIAEVYGADKKPLDHSVYDQWKSIPEQHISNDGQWVMYKVEPQEGDANLIIKNLGTFQQTILPRGEKAVFTFDSRYAVFQIKPPYKETRQAKIDKKKKEDMPAGGLGIVRLGESNVVEFKRVSSYKSPKKGSGTVAIHLLKEKAKKDSTEDNGKNPKGDAENNDKKDKTEPGTHLVVHHLERGQNDTLHFVSDYLYCEDGSRLLYSVTSGDSLTKSGVYYYDTATGQVRGLKTGKGSYKQLAWDEAGRQAAFVADLDTSKSRQRYYSLYYWSEKNDSAAVVADTSTAGLPAHWMISEHGDVSFSKNGERLFFGTAPIPVPEDTTIVEFEVAKVDIWNWKDPLLQPQQLKELEKEKKRSYRALLHLKNKKFVQLSDTDMPDLEPGDEGNADYALGTSNLSYRQLISWEGARYYDLYLVSIKNGSREKIAEKIRGRINISPKGRYIFWFDEVRGNWYAFSVANKKTAALTAELPVSFADELNDVPDYPKSYGHAGWTDGDESLLLYDRYDIWQTDPQNKKPAQRLTDGREEKVQYRYIKLDPEARTIKPDEPMLLKIFDEKDKSEGFVRFDEENPRLLLKEDYSFSSPRKAKDEDVFIFTRGSFEVFPDLWASNSVFENRRQLSNANPQQADYWWGTAELVKWRSTDGQELEGILYKPENFDPSKKYPMIVYFYERNSHTLHRYLEPRPSPSTVRPSFYCSRGYLFFVPDIVYKVGYPGKSAEECVISGVLSQIAKGFVDEKHIGIQGQSWGGYQVVHLVTRTNLFAAAMAGAPVSNMFSAYGGIRWESGLSRMFQYEHQQSRIGGTIWERPMHFWENSPLFHAPDIQTPLLIMHNDNDGAVPWYQGIELFVAMRRLGKPAWLLCYNGEEHNLVQRQNRKDLSRRLQQFFDHYLKGEPAPKWMTEGVPAVLKGKTWGFELTGD